MKRIKGSLISKIIISLIVATTIPFVISNYLSYQITGKAVKEQLVELNINSMSITMSSLHSYLHELSLLGLSYYSDPTLVRLLSAEEPQTPAESVYITQRLEQMYGTYSEVGSVSYKSALTNKQFNIRHNYNPKVAIPDFNGQELSGEHEELRHPFQVTVTNKERRLRVNRPFIDVSTRDVIGLTTFEIKPDQIRRMIASLTTSEQGAIYLFAGEDMELLYATHPERETDAVWQQELNERLLQTDESVQGELQKTAGSYVYSRDTSANGLSLTLVKFIPRSLIDQARSTALSRTLPIQGASIAFVSILAAFISYYMLRRIKLVLQHIKRLQMGNFRLQRKPQTATPDELDLLEIRFQEMAGELDELWNRQYRSQLELSQARLKMLQAQINPHFFYNTLQSIGTMAIKSNARDVSDRLAEFAALFRYSMNIEQEDVFLLEEIEHLEHYLVLQQGRYKQKLQFELECPQEARRIRLPKMTLQPLVENSIVHGLEKGQGHIRITVKMTLLPTALHIEVIDDGKGFTDRQIQSVRASYGEQVTAAEKQGIGLANVLKRLSLYYGEAFQWSIASRPYEHTVVSLRLPIKTSGEDHHEAADRR